MPLFLLSVRHHCRFDGKAQGEFKVRFGTGFPPVEPPSRAVSPSTTVRLIPGRAWLADFSWYHTVKAAFGGSLIRFQPWVTRRRQRRVTAAWLR